MRHKSRELGKRYKNSPLQLKRYALSATDNALTRLAARFDASQVTRVWDKQIEILGNTTNDNERMLRVSVVR